MEVKSLSTTLEQLDPDLGFQHILSALTEHTGPKLVPLRFACVDITPRGYLCETECATRIPELEKAASIFDFRRRRFSRNHEFNVVMLVPTGIGCEVGGHAGDATPFARLLSHACDTLLVHPNVVNASDINEQPENSLYVEGSLLTRLLMGTIGLRRVRANRILAITETRDPEWIHNQTINAINAARTTLGVNCEVVRVLTKNFRLQTSVTDAGRASGSIQNLQPLLRFLDETRGDYDAIALATRIQPHMDSLELHRRYFTEGGINPWGGAEAALTHTVSAVLNVPTAHAPSLSDVRVLNESYGQIDARMAAEVISMTYLFCVLKGLHKSPSVCEATSAYDPSVIQAEDLGALVVPEGTLGLPMLAALAQRIPVITVAENTNLMHADSRRLPWPCADSIIRVNSYLEAAGMLLALKAGLSLSSLRRPVPDLNVVYFDPEEGRHA